MADTLVRPEVGAGDQGRGLEVQVSTQHKRCLIRLRGSFVQESVPTFATTFDRLGRLSFDQVIVDLKGISELDEAGAKVLLGLHHYVTARRAELIVWCADLPMATSVSKLGIRADVPLAVSR